MEWRAKEGPSNKWRGSAPTLAAQNMRAAIGKGDLIEGDHERLRGQGPAAACTFRLELKDVDNAL
jgi:hypothetical protein